MENVFTIIQVIISILLVVTILMQQRGSGLGGAFGGSGQEVFSVKRGAEKVVFNTTVILSILFLGLGIARLVFLP